MTASERVHAEYDEAEARYRRDTERRKELIAATLNRGLKLPKGVKVVFDAETPKAEGESR